MNIRGGPLTIGERRRKWQSLVLFLGLVGCFGTGTVCHGTTTLDSFTDITNTKSTGFILVEVKFAEDGKVWSGRVVRSNAPFSLEASTIDFVKNHWRNEFFAGTTQILPITFSQLPSSSTHWNDDMPPPVDPLAVGDLKRKAKLRVNFGSDGWVQHVEVADPSGVDTIDRQTAIWVKVHWHHTAFAGQTIDVPFEFNPPAPPKPIVQHKRPQPAEEEATAPPAVRVM